MTHRDKPDMRNVEAMALIREVESRDPACVYKLLRAMELVLKAQPGLPGKELLMMMINWLPQAALTKKEKEFLCPNLSPSSMVGKQQKTPPEASPKNAACSSSAPL